MTFSGTTKYINWLNAPREPPKRTAQIFKKKVWAVIGTGGSGITMKAPAAVKAPKSAAYTIPLTDIFFTAMNIYSEQ
jgi:hypothetical protein